MDRIRILLGEDDADHQRLLLLALVNARPSVDLLAVSSKRELLAAARRETFDCIVIDYNLKPDTAPEILRELRPLQEGVPCVVISSSESQEVVVSALREGIEDFVQKQEAFTGPALWRRIEEVVAAARLRRSEQRRANRRLRALERLADTDDLTKLHNRRYIERALRGSGRGPDRRRRTGVVMIDLDHFKRVNDTLGHDAGDHVLAGVAEVLRERSPANAIVGRWGGEEFVVLLQSASTTESWIWADDLRRAISERVVLPQPLGAVTASIGVVSVPTCELREHAISRADHAMYLAKESGRNRVCTHGMARAIDAAHEVACDARWSARERLSGVVERMSRWLGQTQLDHVGGHGQAVRDLSLRVARTLLTDPDDFYDLDLAAEFHDIGKVGIPESLLALPRPLTEGERRLVDEHARFGAEIMRVCGVSARAASIVENHHARFDADPGRRHRRPADPACVLSACDAAVTMVSQRPYAEPRTPAQAVAELKRERGAQFHPDVVDALEQLEQEAPILAAAA